MSDKTSLGDRMKSYETQAEGRLMPGLPIIARIDGRAFHTFTRHMKRPYDPDMSQAMIYTAKLLAEESAALLTYVQSDEISLLFHYDNEKSQTFFNGRRDKLISVLASMASVYFRKQQDFLKYSTNFNQADAFFDCRVFNVPTKMEAYNYFLWRERDATKNSISMAAQSVFNHKELQGKNSSDKQEMLFQKGINWNNYPDFFKRGTYIKRLVTKRNFRPDEIESLPANHEARKNPNAIYTRTIVDSVSVPPISQIEDKVGFIFGSQNG
jgi:tRNA(His) 5'-end guanylyltransferase